MLRTWKKWSKVRTRGLKIEVKTLNIMDTWINIKQRREEHKKNKIKSKAFLLYCFFRSYCTRDIHRRAYCQSHLNLHTNPNPLPLPRNNSITLTLTHLCLVFQGQEYNKNQGFPMSAILLHCFLTSSSRRSLTSTVGQRRRLRTTGFRSSLPWSIGGSDQYCPS